MKKIKSFILLISFVMAAGCEQEVIDLQQPSTPVIVAATTGTANFTKYVTIGTTISAGFQAGALFTDGQNESVGKILSEQFALVNGGAAYNQPTIASDNGFNSSFSNPGAGVIRGRLILFDPDGLGPRSAGPSASGSLESTNSCTGVVTPALPAPYNTANFPGLYTPVADGLNNFSVPGIVIAQILTPATGGPPPPAPNPAYNPYYARFASAPSPDGSTGSTILGDAIGSAPTFFTFELGMNDVLGYAIAGAAGTNTITPSANFSGYLSAAIGGLLGSNPSLKGSIANIIDVTKLPYFTTVAWNSIAFSAGDPTIGAVNGAYAAYNAGLDAVAAGGAITTAERDKRKIVFAAGKNGIVIEDETLTNLTGLGLPTIRQATSADRITLSAGAILGVKAVCDNPSSVYGVGVALTDQYVLLPSEITTIQAAVTAYNSAISSLVTANTTKLALADFNGAYNVMASSGGIQVDGVLLTPSISPPNAAISEDALHPNGRGAAFFANVYIAAINTKFTSTIPYAPIHSRKGTRLPVNP